MSRKSDYIADVEEVGRGWIRRIAPSRSKRTVLRVISLSGRNIRPRSLGFSRRWDRILPEVREEIVAAGIAAALAEVEALYGDRERL